MSLKYDISLILQIQDYQACSDIIASLFRSPHGCLASLSNSLCLAISISIILIFILAIFSSITNRIMLLALFIIKKELFRKFIPLKQ